MPAHSFSCCVIVKYGKTALHLALLHNAGEDVVELLLRKGASVDAQDNSVDAQDNVRNASLTVGVCCVGLL